MVIKSLGVPRNGVKETTERGHASKYARVKSSKGGFNTGIELWELSSDFVRSRVNSRHEKSLLDVGGDCDWIHWGVRSRNVHRVHYSIFSGAEWTDGAEVAAAVIVTSGRAPGAGPVEEASGGRISTWGEGSGRGVAAVAVAGAPRAPSAGDASPPQVRSCRHRLAPVQEWQEAT